MKEQPRQPASSVLNRIAALENALQFYATDDNYISRPIGYALMTRVEMDAGDIAKRVLAVEQENK